VVKAFDLLGSTEVKAILNVAGVHLGASQSIFSAPITLDAGCGVARWISDIDAAARSASTQQCGFAEINGDGLVDRVANGSARHNGKYDGGSSAKAPREFHPRDLP
jgi:hypothetical protein